jgi:hypothetical protein
MSLLLALLVALQVGHWKPEQATHTAKRGKHTATLVVRTKPFDPKAHKLQGARGSMVDKIDGVENPIGTDYSIPTREFESVSLTIDGKKVDVPLKLFSDCFNPSITSNYMHMAFGDDTASVFLFMNGSDGAGSYQAIWCLRKDGRHSRYAKRPIDMPFFDLQVIKDIDQQ